MSIYFYKLYSLKALTYKNMSRQSSMHFTWIVSFAAKKSSGFNIWTIFFLQWNMPVSQKQL